ncbi:MAG TPA: type VI secretion system Vgr family protein [Herbaspirillum sp.]
MNLSLSDLAPDALSALFGTGLSQNARLLAISTAQGSGLPQSLVVDRFTGQECVNAPFRFDIDTLSVSTDIDLKQFIGTEITLRVLQADGAMRAWHGYCTEAAWLGADGGLARYRLRLESFLAFLERRRDSFIFQDMTTADIVAALLAEYPQANFRLDVTQAMTPRPICTQYRESDFAFLARLLAAEGLNYRFDHEQADNNTGNGDGGHADDLHAKHQLVIFDREAKAPAMPGGYDSIRFHRITATEALDAISDFGAARNVRPNAVAMASWHPEQLAAPSAEETSTLNAGELPALSVYDGAGERDFATAEQARLHAQLALQALEMGNKTFDGAGAVRQLAPGHAFALTGHDRYPDGENSFKVLQVSHAAINNFDAGVASLLSSLARPASALAQQTATPSAARSAFGRGNVLEDLESGTYRNTFTAIREAVAILPPALAQRSAPTAVGPQTALVTGLPETAATTDRDHRVKVQFHWQRGAVPNPGGLTDTGNLNDKNGNAPGSDASGTWVRVAEAQAGVNWGSQFTPRVGSEVLVDFIEGDIDRPVVVAQLYNGADLPPYSAGVDSGANHAGTLSGWHSNAHDGGGYNQWVVDDTQTQLRMRLASSTAASQINLGHLIEQPADSAQRGSYRGSGFELRTDAWGVVRGAEGLLLSTTLRPRAGAGVTGTQMDVREARGRLAGAQELAKTMATAAEQQKTLHSADAIDAQAEFIAGIDPQDKGKHPASVNGQPAQKASAGSRDPDASQPVERFAQPIVLMESPSTINWASAASTLLFAGEHLQWTSKSDMHWTAGDTIAGVSANGTSLYAHNGGILAVAANGPVSLQAHTDLLEILADQAVTVKSANDGIEIKANQKIVLQAGQSSVTLEGGNITFACPGTFSVKGAVHTFAGGASAAAALPPLPDAAAEMKNYIAINYRDPYGEPMADVGYKIKFAGGAEIAGKLDKSGSARHENVPEKPTVTEYEERKPDPEQPWNPLSEMVAKAQEKFGQ